MRRFVGRWLSDALRLTLALAMAIAAAQLPALSNEYAAALLQISNEARRDIDQREAAARRYYHLAATTADAAVVAALTEPEPSNAETLARSLQHWAAVKAAYDGITAASPLLRPLVMLTDALDDPSGAKRAVLTTAFATHVPQLPFSSDAASYGLAGLVGGTFLAELLMSFAAALSGRSRHAERWR